MKRGRNYLISFILIIGGFFLSIYLSKIFSFIAPACSFLDISCKFSHGVLSFIFWIAGVTAVISGLVLLFKTLLNIKAKPKGNKTVWLDFTLIFLGFFTLWLGVGEILIYAGILSLGIKYI